MKTLKKLTATLFLLCVVGMASAQDVIVKKDQSTVMSKVLEITSTEIKYKKWNNLDGPTYSINRSEVLSINYENGEVEKFTGSTNDQQSKKATQVQYLNSYMTYSSAGSLFLNGRMLSDKEVQNLVDPQSYQLYLKAGNQAVTGFILDISGGIALVVAGLIQLIETDANDSHSTSFKTKLAFAIGGLTLGMTGWILGNSAVNKVKKIADTYNNTHGNAYSLNISPSLIRYELPQSQGNCGLGLTLSMNF